MRAKLQRLPVKEVIGQIERSLKKLSDLSDQHMVETITRESVLLLHFRDRVPQTEIVRLLQNSPYPNQRLTIRQVGYIVETASKAVESVVPGHKPQRKGESALIAGAVQRRVERQMRKFRQTGAIVQ